MGNSCLARLPEHALMQFAAASVEACNAFLTTLVEIARDDAIARARPTDTCRPSGHAD